MSSEYYTLEKTAEILGINTAEANRLRDRGELRAFRDGVTWKFRKGDVDDYLVRVIRSRHQNEDEDLLSSDEDDDEEEMPTLLADTAAFDLMMEDGIGGASLAINEDLVEESAEKKPAGQKTEKSAEKPRAPVSLSKSAAPDSSGLSLADDDLLLAPDGLNLADDDSAVPSFTEVKNGGSTLDLAEDEDDQLVLSGSGTGNDLNLASDSGLSLLEADDDVVLETAESGGSDGILELDDDEGILSLIDDDNNPTMMVAEEDDFQLKPNPVMESDDSESSSQVIALDEENPFGEMPITDDDAPGMGAMPMGGMGMDGAIPQPAFGGDFGGYGGGAAPGAPAAMPIPTQTMPPTGAYTPPQPTEAVYSPLWVSLSLVTAICIAFAGWMILDMVQNMWSWRGDHTIISPALDMLAGLFGLK